MSKQFKNWWLAIPLAVLFSFESLQAQNLAANGHENHLNSKILGKEIKFTIHLPVGYKASKKIFPVLYYLHGNETQVNEVASIAQKLFQEKKCPELIIVSLPEIAENIDRMWDINEYEQFLTFLGSELIPEITKKYRTNTQGLLYEKSLSGSFALYALLRKPDLFNGYIAASKQWYEHVNDYFVGLATNSLQNTDAFKGRKIFLATLNGAYNNSNIVAVDQEMQAFSDKLGSLSKGAVSSRYQAFDDWGISPQPGFAEGLKFVCPSEKPGKSTPLTMAQGSNGKWVIRNKKKEVLYEVFIYDNGPDYPSEGLIRVVKNGKIGYADAKTYVLVIPPQFDCAFPFENGKAKVSKECKTIRDGEHSMWTSEAWQYVDKQGNF